MDLNKAEKAISAGRQAAQEMGVTFQINYCSKIDKERQNYLHQDRSRQMLAISPTSPPKEIARKKTFTHAL